MNIYKIIYIAILGLLAQSCNQKIPDELAEVQSQLPSKIDYNLHIKPILSDRCFKCHGPDPNKREGGLRLDLVAEATKKQKSGDIAVSPGDIEDSELIKRILSKEHDVVMPTPNSNLTLSNYEKAMLVKWIDEGAEYKDHWAYTKIEKPDLPEIKNKNWVKNAVDNFVLQKLEEKQITPTPATDKLTLMKRAYVDITGLAPTVAEIDAYMKDNSANAYENLVDKLLKSPSYGEKMASDWLDLARYADTNGYQDDGFRTAYPYRDYVINAFNKNMGYDQFIKEQLAGDLMPKPSKDQMIATCFNRNHPQSQEGGIVDEEYRNEYVIDRVNTFGKAFLSISLECARCHDHKYDAVSQKDFFQVYAYFNNNVEAGEIPYVGEASPSLILPTKEAEKKLAFIKAKIKYANEKMRPSQYLPDFDKWLAFAQKNPEEYGKAKPYVSQQVINPSVFEKIKLFPGDQRFIDATKKANKFVSSEVAGELAHYEFDALNPNKEGILKDIINISGTDTYGYLSGDLERKPQIVAGIKGKAIKLMGENGLEFSRQLDFDRNSSFTFSLWVKPFKAGEEGPLFQKSNGDYEQHKGWRVMLNKDGTLMVNMVSVYPAGGINYTTKEKLAINKWTNLTLSYDGNSKASGLKLFINGKEADKLVISDNLQKSILYAKNKTNWQDWSDMRMSIGRNQTTSVSDIAFDEFRAYNRQLSKLEIQELITFKPAISTLLKRTDLTDDEKKALFEYYLLNYNDTYRRYRLVKEKIVDEELQILTDQEEVMVYQELPVPRKTFLLERGQYDTPSKMEVKPIPPSMVKINGDFAPNRMGLANWLTSKENPLTSRVAVNRIWYSIMGRGIVTTVDDFGNQGTLPSHPELLDYLCADFMENGWDVKRLVKTIVTSNTYRQSSLASKNTIDKDPSNELFSRANSYRLSHEQIRDKILLAAGLLTPAIGGPSVFPYQPGGIWEALATRNLISYKQNHNDSLYRRGLYTFWKRSTPPPSALTFDAPDKYSCVVKRQKTSTPLQSLVLLNDPQYMEAARVLAEKMIKVGSNNVDIKLNYAFKALCGRAPKPNELKILNNMYQSEFSHFASNKLEAQKLVSVGEFKRDSTLDLADHAACTMVATTLINFDETIMKR